HDTFEIFNKRILEDYFEVHWPRRVLNSSPECPRPEAASAFAMASSNAAKRSGSTSSHSPTLLGSPALSTYADQDLSASRRSSSGVNFSSSDSISAKLINEVTLSGPVPVCNELTRIR